MMEDWSVEDVVSWVAAAKIKGLDADTIAENEIDGDMLKSIGEDKEGGPQVQQYI